MKLLPTFMFPSDDDPDALAVRQGLDQALDFGGSVDVPAHTLQLSTFRLRTKSSTCWVGRMIEVVKSASYRCHIRWNLLSAAPSPSSMASTAAR